MAMSPFKNPAVEAKFESYPPVVRRRLLALRELVFRTARAHPEADEIDETLKWGEPAYVTTNGAGSTVRIDWKAKNPGRYAMCFGAEGCAPQPRGRAGVPSHAHRAQVDAAHRWCRHREDPVRRRAAAATVMHMLLSNDGPLNRRGH